METFDVRLQCPFSMILSGPSGSGKSEFIMTLLKKSNEILTSKPDFVLYCHGASQPTQTNLIDKLYPGLPSRDEIMEMTAKYKYKNGSMIIIDDLLESTEGTLVRDLFTKIPRHEYITVLFVTQNTFLKSPNYRTMSLNTNYYVFFRNFRDRTPIRSFALQFMPENSNIVMGTFNDIMKIPHGHLLFDLKQTTKEIMRIRSNVLEEPMFVYVPKNYK